MDGLHQHSAQPHVPGVGVHHVGGDRIPRHREPDREGLERGGVRHLRPSRQARPRRVAPHASSRASPGRSRRSSAPRPMRGGRARGSGDPPPRPPRRRCAAGTRGSGAGFSRLSSSRRAYRMSPDRALRLPRLPRAARAAAPRGARRARAARAARARARRSPSSATRPPSLLRRAVLAEAYPNDFALWVGHRGARRAPGRAPGRRRCLPRGLAWSGCARSWSRPSRITSSTSRPRPRARQGKPFRFFQHAPRAGADRPPGADAARVPRRAGRGRRERALLPHRSRRATALGRGRGDFAEWVATRARPPRRSPSAWPTSIPTRAASSASATAISTCSTERHRDGRRADGPGLAGQARRLPRRLPRAARWTS